MISEKGKRAVLPPKREAMLIVPQCDNAGHDLGQLRRDIESQLCNAFGGCTARERRDSGIMTGNYTMSL